jgi:ABC-type sugar transport system permease subunit
MWPAHATLGPASEALTAVVLSLAGLVTAVLAGLGLAVFLRRRSKSYLLVALALLALFARTLVAAASIFGLVGDDAHHLLEHGLDTVMASLVVGAVYYARSVEPTNE